MRISRIQVDRYRNIQNLDFTVPTDSSLLCLTGANGSGKSTLFRLISMAIGQLGLGGGTVGWSVADQQGSFAVTFDFIDEDDELWASELNEVWHHEFELDKLIGNWDKTVTLRVCGDVSADGSVTHGQEVIVPGMDEGIGAHQFLTWIASRFDSNGVLKHLHLQSDRAFDDSYQNYRGQLSPEQLRELSTLLGMKFSSSKSSRDLYSDWIEFTVHTESTRLLNARRLARTTGSDGLAGYEDPLQSLNSMVQRVLPHISVTGTNPESKRLIVGSGDMEIDFQSLSGGEREVLFLCGQIDRLRLTKGILLIDEPELHLNPDLLRRFLTMIQQTAGEGQLWLATHSYEAIEAAGESNTFVVVSPRDEDTTLASLWSQPVVKTLSSALGRVGFGLSNTVFVVVEGSKESVRESQRYSELVGRPGDLNFVDIGEGKRDVIRMLEGLVKVAESSGEQLHVKAVIDSDFDSLESNAGGNPGLHQLGVHEVENLFLEPLSLEAAVRNIERPGEPWDFEKMVRDYADAVAGRWIWNRIQHKRNGEWRKDDKLASAQQCRERILGLSWQYIQGQKKELIQAVADIDESIAREVRSEIGRFSNILASPDLWKHCFGKETLRHIAREVGYSDHEVLERAVINAWNEGRAARPQELMDLREFLNVSN